MAMMVGFLLQILGAQEQESSEKRIAACLDQLASEDALERQQALDTLKAMDPAVIPIVRRRLASLKDPEVLARGRDAERHLLRKDADRLYVSGKLHEALERLAEAEGATDPKAAAEERIGRAKRDIFALIPPVGDRGQRTLPEDQGGSLKDAHGRFAVPALLELLMQSPPAPFHAIRLLRVWGQDAVPPLEAELKGPDEERVVRACEALLHVRPAKPILKQALKSVADDDKRSGRLRQFAHALLRSLDE